jgi:ribonuclease BN (tRNA processing enzyme)
VENYIGQELPTIVVTIQNQKYVFNLLECFQRFAKQHRVKLPKASNIFLTKVTANSIAGLYGFMLTLFDTGNAWDTKIYLQPCVFDYFEEVKYQMGYRTLGYSLADWNGRCRRGFRSMERVQELIKRKDYLTQFHNV